MGRVKVCVALGLVLIISLVSILVPVSTFAKTKITFVLRFPWETKRVSRVAIITPVSPPSKVPTPIPTLISTPTPTVTPIPTNTPTPTPDNDPEPIVQPTIEQKKESIVGASESVESYLMRKMNDYRRDNGLSEIGTDSITCDFAQLRAREIESNFSHEGFRSRIDSGTLPYPNYSYVNENIAQNSDFTRVVDAWIASPSHAENMRQNLSNACIRHWGEYYVFEGWRG